MSRRIFLLLLTLAAGHGPLPAQRHLSERCRLNDAAWVRDSIREISTEGLFAALDPHRSEMVPTRSAAHARQYSRACRLWTEARLRRSSPRYVTASYHQLIDTEQLTDLPSFRELLRLNPGDRDSALVRAGDILRNRLRAWGPFIVDFGDGVDFDREVGPTGKYGFHYWGWSKPLLQSFVLTGDHRYMVKFDELFSRWYGQRNRISRPLPEFDVVYYELGLGVRNRFFIEYDLLAGKSLPAVSRERLMKTLLGAARWLYAIELSEGYRAGNWQMHGSYMLVQIALTYPEFRESAGWLALGLQRLKEHAVRDFLEDGGHSEHSPRNYTLATYGLLRNVSQLLQWHRYHPEIAEQFRARMARTVQWWLTMLTPTGEIPAINDSQRGLFPARILEDAAVGFPMPEAAGVLRALFADSSVSGFPTALPAFTSRHMPASGFTVMRSGWTRDALYMNINHGRYSPTHCHNDMLSFELYAFGRAFAVDAGIGATYDDPEHASWFMSSRAHNMVVINDRNVVREGNEGRDITWDTTNTLQVFSGWHAGYPGARCRRTVVFVKPSYWLVRDDITTKRTGDTVSWYLHSPQPIVSEKGGWSTAGTPGLWILPADTGLAVRTGVGRAASTIDPEPGKTQHAPWIRFDQRSMADSTIRFSLFLVPFRSPAPMPSCAAIGSNHVRITMGDSTDDFYLSPAGSGDTRVTTDAECLWLHSVGGNVRTIAVVGGTFARLDGVEILRLRARGSGEVAVR